MVPESSVSAVVKATTSAHPSMMSCLLHASLSSAVPEKIRSKFATLLTSQSSMMQGWLKAAAPRNILDISLVTEPVSQASGWLKALVSANVPNMEDTELVSHSSGWLKALAPPNVLAMFVTELVSQASSELKAKARLNVEYIFVTLLVSHLEISPLN